jgi:tellurite resistance protein TerC
VTAEIGWVPWIAFNAFVVAMLALDLFVLHRKAHEVHWKEAAAWSTVWVLLSLTFAFGVHRFLGPEAGAMFLTGWLVEKALSVDNIFVFVLIFTYFSVPPKHQHRVLFWGILGALLMRGAMIATGAWLISRFHWIIYIFGAFLVVTGVRMATGGEHAIEPGSNPAIRILRRILPITDRYHGQHFFVREPDSSGRRRWMATPLFAVLVLVESTDVVFAVDSIPAIFAITEEPFLVYTSNIFAILGLRAMYFLLAGVIHKFRLLKLGLAGVLVFVGAKMLVADVVKVPIGVSLGVVAGLLAASIAASLLWPGEARQEPQRPDDPLSA